jgi:hypothetical protein
VVIISHRGNLYGPDPNSENSPKQIQSVIHLGLDVEVDLWWVNGCFYLGHDELQYEVSAEWLHHYRDNLWIHCKNGTALEKVSNSFLKDLRYFFHITDSYTLVSNGVVWTHPSAPPLENSISVLPELWEPTDNLLGICTDYPLEYINV